MPTINELIDDYFLTIQRMSKITSMSGKELNTFVYVIAGCINFLNTDSLMDGEILTPEQKNEIMINQQEKIHKILSDKIIKFDKN